MQVNMFRASSCPSSGATTTAVAASRLPLELGDSSAVGRGRAGPPDHDQQHCYHQAPVEWKVVAIFPLIKCDKYKLMKGVLWLLLTGKFCNNN